MNQPYIPTAQDLLEMSLVCFADHAEELRGQFDKLSDEQRAALVRICRNIAEMEHAD